MLQEHGEHLLTASRRSIHGLFIVRLPQALPCGYTVPVLPLPDRNRTREASVALRY
jgi:hypothetical protein